jgi:hypothetical protein
VLKNQEPKTVRILQHLYDVLRTCTPYPWLQLAFIAQLPLSKPSNDTQQYMFWNNFSRTNILPDKYPLTIVRTVNCPHWWLSPSHTTICWCHRVFEKVLQMGSLLASNVSRHEESIRYPVWHTIPPWVPLSIWQNHCLSFLMELTTVVRS